MFSTVLAFLVLAAEPVAAGTAEPLTDLLARLEESESRLMDLYENGSFNVHTKYRNVDAAGKTKSIDEAETRLFQKDGKPWEEITRFLDEGRDVTARENAKRQKELESGKRKRKDGIPFASPFGKDQQALYTFTDLGTDPDDPSRRRIQFEPKRKSEKTYRGKAVVDATRGALVELSMRPTVFPYFVNKLDVVMEMRTETEVGPALSALRVSAAGKLLFIKKRVEVEASFTDYVPASKP